MISMLLKTHVPMFALALVCWGCGTDSDKPGLDSGRADAVDGFTPDAATGDTRAPLPDTFVAGDGGGSGLDLASDPASPDDAADAGAILDTRAEVSADGTSEAAPADAQPLPDAGCTLLDNIPNLPSISFAAYHTLPEMLAYLQAVAVAAPKLAQYKVLGTSKQGRDLGTLTINATCQANPPAIFFNGAHHGDEAVSAEAVLAVPDYLLRLSASDASLRALLQTYAFTVLPVVNPDGFVANRRENADGDDINRDYPYPGRSESNSFRTREAQLIKSLQESAGFVGAVAFHSGAEEVLWPWCYTGAGTDDETFFLAAGKKTATAMGLSIYQQSYDDYPTTGEYIDYAYAKNRTLAATFEVSNDKLPNPSALAGVVERGRKGAIAWAQAVSDHAQGRLHALPAGPRPRFPFTAPFDGRNRLE
jgi:hypothetical protein